MGNYPDVLGDVFGALADPTRRDVVRRLGDGDASVSELAADSTMALPSFLKHVRVLERSGIVRTTKSGRVRMCSLQRERLALVDDWLAIQRTVWAERTDRLEDLVTKIAQEES